jgi:hypothetical protein
MGGIYSVTTEAEEALAAATAETLVQLTGRSAGKTRLLGWGVSFDGTSASAAPVVVRLLRQTTAGTATAASEVAWDPDDPSAGCTSFHSFTAEPSAGDVLEYHEVHPQGGNLIREYPPGREPVVDSSTASRLAIEANAPAIVNAHAFLIWQE